jgi:hypothetical protein
MAQNQKTDKIEGQVEAEKKESLGRGSFEESDRNKNGPDFVQ